MQLRRSAHHTVLDVGDDDSAVAGAFRSITFDEAIVHHAMEAIATALSIEPQQMIAQQRQLFVLAQRPNAALKGPPGKRRANLEAKAALVFASLPVESVTQAAGDIYGTIRRSLELKGQNIDDNDLWIAASAMSLGATLVSNDQVFTHVPGLVVEDWTSSLRIISTLLIKIWSLFL